MPKKIPPAPKGLPTMNPTERLKAGLLKLEEVAAEIEKAMQDVDATNLTLMDQTMLGDISDASLVNPISASERIEDVLNLLGQLESRAKSMASEARQAGKTSEHLQYAVRSLYRQVLAAGDAERARLAEAESSRQQNMFSGKRSTEFKASQN